MKAWSVVDDSGDALCVRARGPRAAISFASGQMWTLDTESAEAYRIKALDDDGESCEVVLVGEALLAGGYSWVECDGCRIHINAYECHDGSGEPPDIECDPSDELDWFWGTDFTVGAKISADLEEVYCPVCWMKALHGAETPIQSQYRESAAENVRRRAEWGTP